ncbi:MAG: alpha/beta hydrolase [Lachnospiraceae bacterium]|nr:alpha/beta hydrolase [Lachnospiraceae bacterium]
MIECDKMSVLLVILCVFAVVMLVLYVMFYIIFQRNRNTMKDERVVPKGKQYEPYAESILRGVDRVLPERYESVSVMSEDGLKLFGKYYHTADGAPLAIFFHGYRCGSIRDGNGGFVLSKNRGYNVLLVDQRAHGRSEGMVMTFGIKERLDCLQWIRYANERFGAETPIILMGISMGASTVLMAAGEELPPNVRCVVADCPFSSPKEIIQTVMRSLKLPVKLMYPLAKLSAKIYGGFDLEEISATEAVKKSKVPILFIHGDDDRFVPCHMGQACYDSCASDKQILLVKGAGHGLSHCVDAKSYADTVNTFLDKVFCV